MNAPVFVYTALLAAQAAAQATPVTAVIGEAATKRGQVREFPYAAHNDVKTAATNALRAAGLLFMRREVSAIVEGVGGREIRIVFDLVHAETGEVVTLPVTWSVAATSEHIDRPQALAATVSAAEKHTLLQLLGIPVVESTAQGMAAAAERRAAEAAGEPPSWMNPPPLSGPPPHIRTALEVYATHAFRARMKLAHHEGAVRDAQRRLDDPWPDAVASALGGPPREVASLEEQQQVCSWILDPSRRAAA